MATKRIIICLGMAFFIFTFPGFDAWAQESVEIINYQGHLAGATTGSETMIFAIFDTDSPGSDPSLWSESHSSVQIADGVFNVLLGSAEPFPAGLFDSYDDLYLRITVGGEELAPLLHIASTPYAMKADTANHAHTATAADSVLNGTVTGNLLVSGSVGVGNTSIPESLMHLSSMGGIDLIIEADTNNSGGEDQNARIVLRQDGGEVSGRLGYRYEENDLEIMQAFNDDLIFGTNSVDRMTIKNNGNVGIGTATPEAKLHVVMPRGGIPPSTVGGLIIEDNDWNSGNQLEIRDETGGTRMVVDGAGRVGIGTDAPHGGLELKATGLSSPTGYLCVNNELGGAGIRFNSGDAMSHTIYDDFSHTLHIVPVSETGGIFVNQAGNVGIGTTNPGTALTVRGNVTVLSAATGDLILELGEGLDYAEGFDVTEERLDPGTVLSIDAENPGLLTMCRTAYDRKVAGIVAGGRGLGSGVRLGGQQFDQDVALAGRVYCKVDATNERILPGDLLTTSRVSGHAMKVTDYSRAQGAVLGKAMEPLERGNKGLILVLVTLQ